MNKRVHTRRIVRRLIFVLMIITAYIIQCSVLPLLNAPVPVFILIPLLISVAMFEKEFSGFFFGVLTGALWDTAASLPDGILALTMSFFAGFTGLMSRYIIRNTLLNTLILSLAGCIAYSAMSLILVPGSLSAAAAEELIKTVYIPGCASALALAIPVYFTVRAIAMRLREETV